MSHKWNRQQSHWGMYSYMLKPLGITTYMLTPVRVQTFFLPSTRGLKPNKKERRYPVCPSKTDGPGSIAQLLPLPRLSLNSIITSSTLWMTDSAKQIAYNYLPYRLKPSMASVIATALDTQWFWTSSSSFQWCVKHFVAINVQKKDPWKFLCWAPFL